MIRTRDAARLLGGDFYFAPVVVNLWIEETHGDIVVVVVISTVIALCMSGSVIVENDIL